MLPCALIELVHRVILRTYSSYIHIYIDTNGMFVSHAHEQLAGYSVGNDSIRLLGFWVMRARVFTGPDAVIKF